MFVRPSLCVGVVVTFLVIAGGIGTLADTEATETLATVADPVLDEETSSGEHSSTASRDRIPQVDGEKVGGITGGAHEDDDGEDLSPSSSNNSKRLWGGGSAGTTEPHSGATVSSADPTSLHIQPTTETSPSHLSFGFHKTKTHPPRHPPPEGFEISTRVYIDPADKLAHIDNEALTLPYWDCGVSGSTTSPILVKDATFRHSLTPTTSWRRTATSSSTRASNAASDGTHPLVAVALSPLTIETNSGESKSVTAGEAFLLEDGLLPGHKLVPVSHHELQVLFLTLRQTHYHPGKERFHLQTSSTKSASSIDDPCPFPLDENLRDSSASTSQGPHMTTNNNNGNGRIANFIRRGLFGLIGLSFSTLVADFIGKTAPLWLAVGVGGTCFVVGGTLISIVVGEHTLTTIEVWLEQQRLLKAQQQQQHGVPHATINPQHKPNTVGVNSSGTNMPPVSEEEYGEHHVSGEKPDN